MANFRKTFSTWKIWSVILFGFIVSGLLLWNSLSQTTFVKVDTKGTHKWVDTNNNGVIDIHDPSEFISDTSGSYIVHNAREELSRLSLNGKSILYLSLALVFMFGRDFFYMMRIRILTFKQLNWRSSFFVIMMWEFASTLTPGVVGGSALAMFFMKKEGVPIGKGTAIVVITALMDNLFFIVLIPLVILTTGGQHFLTNSKDSSLVLQAWFWAGFGVIFFVALVLSLSIFVYPNLIKNILGKLFSIRFLNKWRPKAMVVGEDVALASAEYRLQGTFFWLRVFGSTLGSWISRYLVINMLMSAFLSVSFADHFIILGKQLILWLFMLVSPTPGGSGVAEYAFSELLAGFSDSATILIIIAILWRLISYFPYLFIGTLLLPKWFKKS